MIDRRQFLSSSSKAIGGALAISSPAVEGSRPCAGIAVASAPNEAESGVSTLLFFDDWPLDRRDHVERHVGHPEWHPDATFVDSHLNLTWGYPTIFRDSETGQWRCLYQGWDHDRKRLYPLMAESKDGIKWQAPDLSSKVHLPGRVHPNQVLPVTAFSEWSPCYFDQRAAASERLKGLVFFDRRDGQPESHLWVSPDGLLWRCIDGIQWQRNPPDPVTCVCWNEYRKTYVLTTRPSVNDRRIAVAETVDWRTFSDPELALEADALDTSLAQLYGMPVFPYEGWYIGLLWIFHVSPQTKGESPLKFLGGRIDSQLSYSRNGWHFQRGLRDAFMPNSDFGRLGAGCLQPSCMILDEAETLRIYSCAARHEHGILIRGDGGLLLHTLRRDGFTYLESMGAEGVIGTRPLLWRGEGIFELNALAPDGEMRVQITDSTGALVPYYSFADSVPFTGDSLHWEPRWKGQRSLQSIPARTLRIEVLLNNARLYAIRGNFQLLTARETIQYEQRNESPSTNRRD